MGAAWEKVGEYKRDFLVDAVEDVSIDLFNEWRDEIELIGNPKLNRASAKQLKASEKKYADLIRGVRRAESKMAPVLNTFRSQAFIQDMELAGGWGRESRKRGDI